MSNFASPWPIVRSAADAFRPPKRVSVSQGAAQHLFFQQAGGYSGPWSPSEAPYMIEPMDMLASRRHEAVCFVGPARTGKTAGLLDGWFAYAVTCDPGDMLIVQMSQEKAREYSKTRIDRAIRHSPAISEKMSKRGHDDNTHDKLFRHGMWVKIGWPSATQLSSSDYRYVALTDYDRMPDNIDGEGAAYGLAIKRTQTFLSRGMGMVESSPGREITDPHWRPATPHEAPPCSGILGIYNRSDRRRWYWKCPDCADYFEASPGLELFSTLPKGEELIEMVRGADLPAMASQHAKVVCPHCGSIIEQKWKPALNDIATARWVGDGQRVVDGEVVGEFQQSSIAGYWLGGVAAAYQKWDSIILRYLQGMREYALTGSELALKTTVNTDQGIPYLPRHLAEETAGNRPEDRAEDLERYIVPPEARFLIASIDVQGGSRSHFVVEVRAFGPHLESWLVDRYTIATTERNGVKSQVDPAGYSEDWDLLTEKVVKATYRLTDGREMRVKLVAVDTGGEAGATPNAYAWYSRVRKAKLTERVMLVKGASQKPDSPVVRGHGRDPKTKRPMRNTPVFQVDTDYFKDAIAGSLRRTVPGPTYGHFPDWLPASYYSELQAEVRGEKGKWKKLRARNEALDCWVYALAACELLGFGTKGKHASWERPPEFALPQSDANTEIIMPEERRAERKQALSKRQVIHQHNDDGGWNFERRY